MPKEINAAKGNSLEKYFGSPETKKCKKSSSSPNNGSPPAKKMEKGQNLTGSETHNLDKNNAENNEIIKTGLTEEAGTTTPTSDKVCKHLDTQLNDMEKRLESSLSASLSASITASVTAGLKDLIDSSLKTALETMKNSVDEAIEQNLTVRQHGEQIDSLETENLILKSKMSAMEGEHSLMKKKLANIETRALQHNIIVRGIMEDEWEKETTTRHKVYLELTNLVSTDEDTKESKLEMAKNLEIRSCKRLGKYVKDRARPISVEFIRKDDVNFILSNKMSLRKGVFADKEFPQDIEKKRKILRPIFTAAKSTKKYKKRCRLKNDLLIIKRKCYGVEDMHTLPKSLKPVNVSSKNNQTVYGYFGELNPLSNFYRAPFTLGDKNFHCSEQFIQWKKAELFKDKTVMKRIDRAWTGQQCKEEGRNISNYKSNIWEKMAKKLCKPGIKQKFIENKIPREVLLQKTHGKKIVECTKDSIWGCGMPLKDENCLESTKWTSQGIMGKLLQEIREELGGGLPHKPHNRDQTPTITATSKTTDLLPTSSSATQATCSYKSSSNSSSESGGSDTDMQD